MNLKEYCAQPEYQEAKANYIRSIERAWIRQVATYSKLDQKSRDKFRHTAWLSSTYDAEVAGARLEFGLYLLDDDMPHFPTNKFTDNPPAVNPEDWKR